eukprot:tig00001472_g8882.t1
MPAQRGGGPAELAEAIPTDGSDFFVAPCPGTVNNNKGELLAVLTAFLKSPEGCTVKTDSSTAMSLIRRSVLHRADSTSPRRRRRKATRREPETDSDADDSGSYVSYLSAPDDLPPEPSDAELYTRDKGCTPGARTRFRALITTCPSTSIERQTRKARREERQRRRDALAALGPHVPALAGLPIAQRMERRRSPCTPAPRSPRSRSRIRPRRLGCRKTCMASTASLEGYDSSRAYRVESDPRAHVRAVCEMRNFVRLTSLESSWLGAPADRARLAREFRKQGASRDASAPFNARLAQLTKFSMELAPLLPVRARDAPHLYGNINPQGLADSPHSPPTNPKATSRSDAPPPSPWPPLPPSEEEVLRQISSPLLGTSGSINVTRRSLSRLNGRGPQRLHNKLVARGVSPFDFDVLLFPIHSPGHWTFAAIHSRLERSWPRFSAGSSSSAGNATFPQTTPPPGRLHRPPDALPQANGPQHPDPAPEADRRRQALPPD